eukprot:TRINITY_DN35330_c1_g1_i6.p1 TRINITY_DN35330_c1_g1~~TRINITY_DN35330_c1_g1_i6.p1  ORF type:complete len:106 (+),score=12.77 TRINITY_DN35330_c1_g1_i6:865-1182(+)
MSPEPASQAQDGTGHSRGSLGWLATTTAPPSCKMASVIKGFMGLPRHLRCKQSATTLAHIHGKVTAGGRVFNPHRGLQLLTMSISDIAHHICFVFKQLLSAPTSW